MVIAGGSVLASELRQAAADAGWRVCDARDAARFGEVPFLLLDCVGDEEPEAPLQGGPQAVCCPAGSRTALHPGGANVGFHALPPLAESQLVELLEAGTARAPRPQPPSGSLPRWASATWVGDAPGRVLDRIVCQVINEAAFALAEGIGRAVDVDAGMVHGLNHPRGPLEWADTIGLDHVLAVLDGLFAERREERYRAAPLLRELVLSGRIGRLTGKGFFGYEPLSAP